MSSERVMKGSSPQGTLIGVKIFIININIIAFQGDITLQVHHLVTEYWQTLDSIPNAIRQGADPEMVLEDRVNFLRRVLLLRPELEKHLP